jgi:hypothetical protein
MPVGVRILGTALKAWWDDVRSLNLTTHRQRDLVEYLKSL